MKENHFFVKKDDLLSTEKIQKMTELVNKRQDLVNFTVKDSYREEKSTSTWLISSGFPNKSDAFFVFSSFLSGVYLLSTEKIQKMTELPIL